MSTLNEIILYAAYAVGVLFFFLMARNDMTYRIKMHFIDTDHLWPKAYNRLPSYDEMLGHPKHWLRWTKRQWLEYVEAA